jgi:hypothetical protein
VVATGFCAHACSNFHTAIRVVSPNTQARMEIQKYEFTMDELLVMHRYWITNLYLKEKKSVQEIALLLQEQQIFVS